MTLAIVLGLMVLCGVAVGCFVVGGALGYRRALEEHGEHDDQAGDGTVQPQGDADADVRMTTASTGVDAVVGCAGQAVIGSG